MPSGDPLQLGQRTKSCHRRIARRDERSAWLRAHAEATKSPPYGKGHSTPPSPKELTSGIRDPCGAVLDHGRYGVRLLGMPFIITGVMDVRSKVDNQFNQALVNPMCSRTSSNNGHATVVTGLDQTFQEIYMPASSVACAENHSGGQQRCRFCHRPILSVVARGMPLSFRGFLFLDSSQAYERYSVREFFLSSSV
jgi:hypothetical protein